jgi:two-component sensor histidine kinase
MKDAVWDEPRLRIATDAAGVALWSWNVDTDRIDMDERAFELWGVPVRDKVTFEELSARIHPADLDKVRAAFNATRDLTGAYETDFRILHDDDVRWVSARGRGDDQGIIGRIMFGVFLDVTVRKLAEEAREMVTSEMQHRIKNLFSITSALAGIAARTTGSKEEMAGDLMRRLTALSAAHDLIHPAFSEQKRAVVLADLLAVLLKAYAQERSNPGRVSISAPEVLVGEQSITALAMIIHELATNAAKYGALSAPEGRLEVACTEVGHDVELVWRERGGPSPDAPFAHEGFGGKLTARVVAQIGGTLTRDWTRDGVTVTLRMSKARLGA